MCITKVTSRSTVASFYCRGRVPWRVEAGRGALAPRPFRGQLRPSLRNPIPGFFPELFPSCPVWVSCSCLGFDKRSDEALPVGECTRQPGKLSSNSFALTIKCDGSQFPPKHHLVRKLQITPSIPTVRRWRTMTQSDHHR
jgi:hypothetical protein